MDFAYSFHWWHLLVVSGIYGLVTHLTSLPVYAYNDNHDYKKQITFGCIPLFFFRVLLGLPYRILLFGGGLLIAIVTLPIFGKPYLEVLKQAWKWHDSPEKIYRALDYIGGVMEITS